MARLVPVLLLALLGGCAQYENRRGVEVTWDAAAIESFRVGETRRAEVLERLGPPSQLISLGDETVLYYLYEHADGEGLILLAYNRFKMSAHYDRAVFIFDANDRLNEYATHIQNGQDR
ncbi:MAG: hypothetical protein ACK5HY_03600 [Parahaliea sp.]